MPLVGRSITLHLVPGTPVFGVWCPHCLLPSAVEAAVHILTRNGPQQFGFVRTCIDCGELLQ